MQKITPITWLKGLIAIPSFSKDEKKASDYFENVISSFDYSPQRIGNNILVSGKNFSTSKPNILLNSHIDTVSPSKKWTIDPFTPTEKDGKLYGLGSNDAGASLVSLLAAFIQLDKSKHTPYNYFYAVSAEEEITGKNGFEKLFPFLPKIDLAIVGEPTKMEMAIAEKGLMVVDGYAHGKAGHAARNEGINAIYLALQDIEKIQNYHFDKVSEWLGEVKCTVTQIEAGKQHNVVPDICHYVIDVRSNELYTNQEVLSILQKLVSSELKERSFRLNATQSPINHPIIQKGIEKGIKHFGSPTLSDQCIMPFYSVKMGVGDSARSHTADEFVYIYEIEEAITIYIDLLK